MSRPQKIEVSIRQAVFKGWKPAKIRQKLGVTDQQIDEQVAVLSAVGIRKDMLELAVPQVACLLGVIPRRVRAYCLEGRLGRKIGGTGQYVIDRDEMLHFLTVPRPVGHPGREPLREHMESIASD